MSGVELESLGTESKTKTSSFIDESTGETFRRRGIESSQELHNQAAFLVPAARINFNID